MTIGRRSVFVLALASQFAAAGCGSAARGTPARVEQTQPGDLALDYVTAQNFRSLKVEVDFIEGFGPSLDAIAKIRDLWERRLDKPGGVDVVIDTEIPRTEAKEVWEIGDIVALEGQHRANFTGDRANRGTAVIWVVYLNGKSEFDSGQSRALGVAYEGSSVAVFRENVDRTSSPEVRDNVEALVLAHEGGHLFGLVNNGVPMVNDHEDRAHPRHDVNSACAMYFQIETANTELLRILPPLDYDYECRLDMFAAGGLAPSDAPPGEPGPPAPPRPPRRDDGEPALVPDLVPLPER
jgi:hypothetical protein